ncbi:MAG: hypothetical protein ACOY3P_04065 [Planctomycetota bacterium]
MSSRVNPESLNHDSFLDIVANLVGIMIILVMLVGARVRQAPEAAAVPGLVQDAVVELQRELGHESELHAEVLKLGAEVESLERQAAQRDQGRLLLAAAVTAMERRLQETRSTLDGDSSASVELSQELARLSRRLEEVRQARSMTDAQQPQTVVVKDYPTPISRQVDADEVHVQLRNSRVAIVPLERLLEELKEDVVRQIYKLRQQPELTDTVGPIGGFRMRYTMETKYLSEDLAMASGRAAYAQLKRFTLIPSSSELGEPIDVALHQYSQFHALLGAFPPERATVTVWVYPESFAAFRRLREDLYQRGYAVAARPLPADTPIGGSPQGSKSAAQ